MQLSKQRMSKELKGKQRTDDKLKWLLSCISITSLDGIGSRAGRILAQSQGYACLSLR